MVKPQFEVGRERVGAGGVVRDPALRAEAVRTWPRRRRARPAAWRGAASPLPGPSGNVEFFVWLPPHAAAGRTARGLDAKRCRRGRPGSVASAAPEIDRS